MMRIAACLFAFFALVVIAGSAPVSAAAPDIRVAVALGQHSIELAIPPAATLSADGRKLSLPEPASARVVLAADKTGFLLNKNSLGVAVLTIQAPDNATIEVNRRRYRGAVTVKRNGAAQPAFDVINTLPLEQYLYGVLPAEMPASWPKEALKAQAIAARSFALALREANQQKDYDVTALIGGQAYGGYAAEQSETNQVVDATRGLALTYGGHYVPGYYHSVSGGYTETSGVVWGANKPYLQASPDVETKAPQEKWEKVFTPDALDQYFAQAGFAVGKLEAIQLSVLKKPPMSAGDRGASGRVKQLRLIGKGGEANVDGNRLRQILQLPSTLFDISVVNETPKEIAATITDQYGNPVLEKKIPVDVADQPIAPLWSDAKDMRRISRGTGVVVRFSGQGFGHGVGMSQWGAKTIAEQAKPEDKEVYKAILFKYYQGVALAKAYDD